MPSKKDPYTSASQKVLGLYAMFLFTGRSFSLPQLAELFHCSKQTVLRMIEQIEMNHRLELETWYEGSRKWYRARPLSRRPNVTLNVEAALTRKYRYNIAPGQKTYTTCWEHYTDFRDHVAHTIWVA